MRISTRLVVVITLLGCSAALALAPACEVFTRETCNAADLVGIQEPTANAGCKECLERAATCDTVGRCNDVAGCTQGVREAHQCVLGAGNLAFKEEARCVGTLNETSKSAYEKMRANCGKECLLPVCKVDQATVRFGSADCDKCVTGACCDDINRCYANRTCKLILECIVRCPNPLTVGGDGGFVDPGPNRGPCSENDDEGGPPGGPNCIAGCLSAFANHEQRVEGAKPDAGAQCLAFSIRQCAINARCTDSCDGGFDTD